MDKIRDIITQNENLRKQESFLPNNETLSYVNQTRERAKTQNLMNTIIHNNPTILRKS